MGYLDFRKQLTRHPFFSLEMLRLIDPTFSRVQLTRWQQKGYIRSIIRGWYIFSVMSLLQKNY